MTKMKEKPILQRNLITTKREAAEIHPIVINHEVHQVGREKRKSKNQKQKFLLKKKLFLKMHRKLLVFQSILRVMMISISKM